jgi:2-dehydro-3-deoxygluconokinase
VAERRRRVVLFGDLLLRLNPPGLERLVQAAQLEVRFTGAEANAGVSLVNYGVDAAVVSRVPDTDLGQACINYLRRFGLDTTHVNRVDGRLGILLVEAGVAQRPTKVIYDRSGTAFATGGPDDYPWDEILDGADWLHFSGTAPAMGGGVAAALELGVRAARSLGIQVSCDLNYRAMLWSPERAGQIMSRLMPHVTVLIGNEEDAHTVFGVRADGTDVRAGRLAHKDYEAVSRRLVERFGFRYVATTLRESVSASINRWSCMLADGESAWRSRVYEINPIVDRVGAGDAFSGALILALLENRDPQRAVDFAAAASCLKHSVPGDFNLVSRRDVERLVAGDASGRVQR